MIPVLTPVEMSGVDREAADRLDELVGRAGQAVALAARRMLAGAYGRRVLVVAGPGNNGADGRAAARQLARRGAHVRVLDAQGLAACERLPTADLVIDAAYGTGLSRPYRPPDPRGAPVLAVDIPSGVSGRDGTVVGAGEGGGAVFADRTVTFEALKPGLVIGTGPDHAGEVVIAPIGLADPVARAAQAWVVEDADVAAGVPPRGRNSHKWKTALAVVAGSPAMPGAALLVARGAMRAGSGYALVGVPGAGEGGGLPPGAQVARGLPADGWERAALEVAARSRALVVGPGLAGSAPGGPTDEALARSIAELLRGAEVPAVVDADAITALASSGQLREVVRERPYPTVLTPHDGEYERITGHAPGADRIADVRAAASETGAVVLLKGSPSIVSDPEGRVLIARAGSSRLATAGTGDVLSGVVGAFLARGLPAPEAAALGAHAHGRAAGLGAREGLVATDLPDLVSRWLSEVAP